MLVVSFVERGRGRGLERDGCDAGKRFLDARTSLAS